MYKKIQRYLQKNGSTKSQHKKRREWDWRTKDERDWDWESFFVVPNNKWTDDKKGRDVTEHHIRCWISILPAHGAVAVALACVGVSVWEFLGPGSGGGQSDILLAANCIYIMNIFINSFIQLFHSKSFAMVNVLNDSVERI